VDLHLHPARQSARLSALPSPQSFLPITLKSFLPEARMTQHKLTVQLSELQIAALINAAKAYGNSTAVLRMAVRELIRVLEESEHDAA
jgi:hypothetical protein